MELGQDSVTCDFLRSYLVYSSNNETKQERSSLYNSEDSTVNLLNHDQSQAVVLHAQFTLPIPAIH